MTRFATLAPVAILTTACAVRTPATALDATTATTEATHQVDLPSDREAIHAWSLPPSSPWARYEKLTLLTYLADDHVVATMPDVDGLEIVGRARRAASRVAAAGVPLDTMWVIDLRGAASVAFGATLSQEAAERVAPVMTFNNWPAESEVVPAEQTLAALVTMSPRRLAGGELPAAPVFLLDAWRLALRDTTPDPAAMDNRYVLLGSDFPDPAELRVCGIRRVVYVVEDRSHTTTEEDDFHEVALVDLSQLAAVEPAETPERFAERWDEYIEDWGYSVRERRTVFDDPQFYERARGGFGGVRAAPAPRGFAAGRGHAGEPTGMGGRAYSGASPHVSGVGGG
jgi:hypothetical protein